MTCTTACIQPSPSQAHCGACHVTFGGVSGFDRHRRDGQCLAPDAIGYVDNGHGVYRAPMTEAGRARLALLRDAQGAETGPGVVPVGVGDSEAAETHRSHDTESSSTFPGAEHCRRCGWFTRFSQGPDTPPRVTRKGAAECVPMRIELREDA